MHDTEINCRNFICQKGEKKTRTKKINPHHQVKTCEKKMEGGRERERQGLVKAAAASQWLVYRTTTSAKRFYSAPEGTDTDLIHFGFGKER